MAKKKHKSQNPKLNSLKVLWGIIIILFIVNVFKLLPFTSDILWEIKTGKIVISERKIPKADNFSVGEKKRWICVGCFSSVPLYLSYKIAKFSGVKYFFIFLFLATILLLYKLAISFNEKNKLQFWIWLIVYFLLSVPLIKLHLSFILLLFAIGFLSVLETERKKSNSFYIFLLFLWTLLFILYNPIKFNFTEPSLLNFPWLTTICFTIILFINLICIFIKYKAKNYNFIFVLVFIIIFSFKDYSWGILFLTLPFVTNTFNPYLEKNYFNYKLNLLEKDLTQPATFSAVKYASFFIIIFLTLTFLKPPANSFNLKNYEQIYKFIASKKTNNLVLADLPLSNFLFFKAGKLKPVFDGRLNKIYETNYLENIKRFFDLKYKKVPEFIKNIDFICITNTKLKYFLYSSTDFILIKQFPPYSVFISNKETNWKYLNTNARTAAKNKFITNLINTSYGYIQKKDYKTATTLLTKAQKIQPQNIDIDVNLGVIKISQKNFLSAKKIFLNILKINPNYTPALYNLAFIYQKQKNFTASIKIYKKILQQNPKEELATKLLQQAEKSLQGGK